MRSLDAPQNSGSRHTHTRGAPPSTLSRFSISSPSLSTRTLAAPRRRQPAPRRRGGAARGGAARAGETPPLLRLASVALARPRSLPAGASLAKYLAASGALRRIAEAPAVAIPDIRYSLLAGLEEGESRLAVVRGLVRSPPGGTFLIPPGSREHCVITRHTQTVSSRFPSSCIPPSLRESAIHAIYGCLGKEFAF